MSSHRRRDPSEREVREPIYRADDFPDSLIPADAIGPDDEYLEEEGWDAFGEIHEEDADAGRRRKRRRGAFVTGLVVFVVVLLAVVAGGGYAIHRALSGSDDYAGAGLTPVTVQVQAGDTATNIADTLQADSVVKTTKSFIAAAAADTRSRSIQPGYYKLKTQMKASLALDALLDPANVLATKVVIPEGFTAAQIVARIAAHSQIKTADLQAALAAPADLGLPSYANGRVEGFLFPATYDIDPSSTAVQALNQLTAAFQRTAAGLSLNTAAQSVGLTPLQVVTAASLVQAEVKPADFAKVAEVIFNRLHDKHPLGLETAERYGAGISGSQPLGPVISKAEASPYDTYVHAGLPIGPINNPGEAALQSILHPATGDLYFYLTDPKTNVTTFFNSNDYAGFEAASNLCKNEGGCR